MQSAGKVSNLSSNVLCNTTSEFLLHFRIRLSGLSDVFRYRRTVGMQQNFLFCCMTKLSFLTIMTTS